MTDEKRTIKGSVVRPTEIMSERDSINAFIEGSKRADFLPHHPSNWI